MRDNRYKGQTIAEMIAAAKAEIASYTGKIKSERLAHEEKCKGCLYCALKSLCKENK